MASCYIAVDIGSSYIKSAVLDLHRRSMDGVRRVRTPLPLAPPGGTSGRHETDADAIVHAVREMIDGRLAERPDAAGVLLATQMHGFVLADAAGNAITPYISWQDERCMEPVGRQYAGTHLDLLRTLVDPAELARTGIDLKPGLAMGNVFHWLRQRPDGAAPAGTRFCTLGSYVVLRLTGRNVCHLTNAAATGFADIAAAAWNRRLIEAAGCGKMAFPDLAPETEPAGRYEGRHGTIPIHPDLGDHQASVLGSLAAPRRDVVVTVGTAGLMSRVEDAYRPGAYEIRPFVGGLWLNTITRLPGGRNLEVLADFVRDIGETVFERRIDDGLLWDRLGALAARAAEAERDPLRVSVGFFPSQRGVREGGFTGVDSRNLRIGNLLRGAFEDMADIYAAVFGVLCPDRSDALRLICSGGVLSRSDALAGLLRQKAGVTAVRSPLPDESLAGLYRVALVCSGRCADYEESRRALLDDSGENRIALRVAEST